MLLSFIILYLLCTLLVGVLSARLIKNSTDFILAGRRLPLILAASALFATWFGSETVLGASSEFVQHGILGVIEDPFGAALCLLLVGIFFARPLYKMKLLTIGDFYRNRFGKKVELISSIFMVLSYFGWIAAQLVAMGIILHAVANIPYTYGVLLGAAIVIIYTYIGGMWAISITDFIQTVIIISGLVYLAVDLSGQAGGVSTVLTNTPDGFFQFYPDLTWEDNIHYFAAWITIGLGSIAQQDVFQRVMASRNVKVAVNASYLSAFMYLSVGIIPLFIGLCTLQVYPEMVTSIKDSQLVLPTVVLTHTSMPLQILFFGALISAIMSTTSGAILAPASILAENIIKPFTKNSSDTYLLRAVRVSVILIALIATIMANLQSNIYELVGQSSALSLVSLFVPLTAGLYWKRATEIGALLAMCAGMLVWLWFEFSGFSIPSLIPGLMASVAGQLVGDAWHRYR